MASLQRYSVGGRQYYRIVESKRVNGKPRAIPIMHLGTADALLSRLTSSEDQQLSLQSFRHGDVAAIKQIADEVGVVEVIDAHIKSSRRKLSVGTTLLLSVMNRLSEPTSKRKWSQWAEGTSVKRFFPSLKAKQLTSQYFWDQMSCVPEEAIAEIEEELTRRVSSQYKPDLGMIFYDTTNCYTYLHPRNERSALAKHGHSKEGRDRLRLFSVSLMVTRKMNLPLCHHVFPGNMNDTKDLPPSLDLLRDRLSSIGQKVEETTIVFDKGFNSSDNHTLLDKAGIGFIAAHNLFPYQELYEIPMRKYTTIRSGKLKELQYYKTKQKIGTTIRPVVVYVSESLREHQARQLELRLSKKLKELHHWQRTLDYRDAKQHDLNPQSIQKRIEDLLKGAYIKDILHIDFDLNRPRSKRLSFTVDEKAKYEVIQKYFGKQMLITNRQDWDAEELIGAYFQQADVENAFRQLKDHSHIAIRPQFHWTDQKIRVHAFTCFLALLLGRVLQLKASQHGFDLSLPALIDVLRTIRLGMVLQSQSSKGSKPRCSWQLEMAPPETQRLFELLAPNYTS